jgi:hypothetical protein
VLERLLKNSIFNVKSVNFYFVDLKYSPYYPNTKNMKTLRLAVILMAFALCSFGQKLPVPADKKATKETIALFQSLFELKNKGVIYGHQDDLMYGYNWWYEKDRSDTKDATGDYPGVAGFELGHIELGSERSLDSVSFNQIAQQIKAHYKR